MIHSIGSPTHPSVSITPYRSLRRVVLPSALPVLLTEAKAHCRVDSTAEDSYIASLIAAASEYVEETLDCTLLETTWEAKYDCLPLWELVLPRPPMRPSAVTVTYIDANSGVTTLSSSLGHFQVDSASIPGRIHPLYLQTWPPVRGDENCVTVRWSAGYASAVPPTIKHMILLAVGHWFANREPVASGSMMPVPMTLETLAAQASWGLYR